MTDSGRNPKVDAFLGLATAWRHESELLRKIALGCGLTEEIKWGKPCYTLRGKNVVLIQGFRDYVALLFFKGALLHDPDGVLVRVGQNSRAARQLRFTSAREIAELRPVVEAYVDQAVEVERAGLKVDLQEEAELPIPDELRAKLDDVPGLEAAFDALTPGRRRGYLLHFSAAKQSKTRTARVERCTERILAGKGLYDR